MSSVKANALPAAAEPVPSPSLSLSLPAAPRALPFSMRIRRAWMRRTLSMWMRRKRGTDVPTLCSLSASPPAAPGASAETSASPAAAFVCLVTLPVMSGDVLSASWAFRVFASAPRGLPEPPLISNMTRADLLFCADDDANLTPPFVVTGSTPTTATYFASISSALPMSSEKSDENCS